MSVNKFKVDDVVKCVDVSSIKNLTLGKEYIVTHSHIGDDLLYLYDDNGDEACYSSYRFELCDSTNAKQPHEFKEGDMVYLIGFGYFKPCKLLLADGKLSRLKFKIVMSDGNWETFSENGCYKNYGKEPRIVLATEENRQMLNKLLGVEYEPVKLTGSDLAKKRLIFKPQTCYVSDSSDEHATLRSGVVLIVEYENDRFISKSGVGWKFAVPCNQHGECILEDE